MPIDWNDNLITGIAVIDEQHESLFKTINKLEKSKDSREVFYEVLIELKTYMLLHFNTEEKYMRDTAYSEYEEHKDCHDKFVTDFKKLFKKISSQGSVLDSREELINFIENWIENHYTNEDVKLAKFLTKNSPK